MAVAQLAMGRCPADAGSVALRDHPFDLGVPPPKVGIHLIAVDADGNHFGATTAAQSDDRPPVALSLLG
jgi:hypothetical protein